ncbi:MAG: PfkB family carbohydrate kinase [Candidatus Pristimantibacillus sp.]
MPMDREQQILTLIRQNSFISQQEIADHIGISRSAVAGYIAALTRKGIIIGRAYVTAEAGSVICIGGANMDSKVTGKQPLRLATSNPVKVTESCGGVARNIAANLASLSSHVLLLTIVGDDKAGAAVLDETKKLGVDVSLSIVHSDETTGCYTALLDEAGEMFLAFASMDIYDRFTPELLQERWPRIAPSKLVIADTNLPADCLEHLILRCQQEGIPLFIDPVSSEKAKKLPHQLHGVTAIFPNLEEAYQIANLPASPNLNQDLELISQTILERGVQHVFITLGKQGVHYTGEEGRASLPSIPSKVVEVTGAGDAFVAGVAHGVLNSQSFMDACKLGLVAAHITIQTSRSAASPLTGPLLQQTMKELSL